MRNLGENEQGSVKPQACLKVYVRLATFQGCDGCARDYVSAESSSADAPHIVREGTRRVQQDRCAPIREDQGVLIVLKFHFKSINFNISKKSTCQNKNCEHRQTEATNS